MISAAEIKRPDGKPSLVLMNWEFFGKRPTQNLELSSGNCCTSNSAKIAKYCSSSPKQCCRNCKVFSYDPESSKDNRIHFISSINGGFKLSQPPGRPTMNLQMIWHSSSTAHGWKKFEYYGLLSTVEKVQQMGTCCIREHETQVKACGAGGYCCAPCSADSRIATEGEEMF